MTLKRVYGPYTMLEVESELIYGPSFMVHPVLKIGVACKRLP